MNTEISNTSLNHRLIDGFDVIITSIYSLAVNTLFGFIFAYLSNVSLAKQCLLLYLYKDFVLVFIAYSCWLEVSFLYVYTYGDVQIDWIPAAIIAFGVRCGVSVLLPLAAVISFIKYRMKKETILDPAMPWGEDDEKGMKWIRIFCWGPSIGGLSTMYACNIYPTLVYIMIGHDSMHSESYIYVTMDVILIVTNIILMVGGKYYKATNEQRSFEALVPMRILYLFWNFLLLLGIGMIIVLVSISSLQYGFWIFRKLVYILFLINTMVLAGMMLKTEHVKAYAKKFARNLLDEAFLRSIYLVPATLFTLINGSILIVYKAFDI